MYWRGSISIQGQTESEARQQGHVFNLVCSRRKVGSYGGTFISNGSYNPPLIHHKIFSTQNIPNLFFLNHPKDVEISTTSNMVILWGQQKLGLWEACLDIVEEYMRPASKIDHDDASLTDPHAHNDTILKHKGLCGLQLGLLVHVTRISKVGFNTINS